MPRLSQWYLRVQALGYISPVGYLEWNCQSGIYEDWNSTTTPNHSIAPTLSILRVWHPPQFVRLNRILFHTGDSQLLLMLIISRSLTIYTSSLATIYQTYECRDIWDHWGTDGVHAKTITKTPEILTSAICFFVGIYDVFNNSTPPASKSPTQNMNLGTQN